MKSEIVIIDDHPVFSEGLKMMIGVEPDLEVVQSADSYAKGLEWLGSAEPPDLLVVDISLGDGNGLELISRARETFPALPILVLSAHDERSCAERALKAGAMGYIMKTQPREKLLEAIRKVVGGGMHWSPEISQMLLKRMAHGESDAPQEIEKILSTRELEIFRALGEGLETDAIARRFFLSPKTVRAHRNNMARKLKLRGSVQLYQAAFQWLHNSLI